MTRSLPRDAVLTAVVATLLAYSWMFGAISVPNERSRLYLSVDLVDHHTLTIDAAVRRFGPVYDAARFEDHWYTDKAPGLSFVGAAVYAIATLFGAGEWPVEDLVDLERTWLMVPLGVLGFLFLRATLRRLDVREAAVDATSLAFSLGTCAFHYAAAFVGHFPVALALLASVFWLLPRKGAPPPRWAYAAAGAAAGFAGLCEYQAIPAAFLLFVVVLVAERRALDRVLFFALGAVPFAAGLLVYDALAFGSPFELSYAHLADPSVQARHARGIAGVGWPTKEAIVGSLLSLHRGLLLTTPVVLAAPFGIVALYRRGARAIAIFVAGTLALYIVMVAGADMWFAGWGFGPRLSLPALGVAFVAVGVALDRADGPLSALVRGAAAVGIVVFGLVTETFPELPPELGNPLIDSAGPLLARGLHSPSLVTRACGDYGLLALVPAWILTAGILAWILRPDFRAPASRALRWSTVPALLAVPALVAAVIASVGPIATPVERDRYVDWVATLVPIEARRHCEERLVRLRRSE